MSEDTEAPFFDQIGITNVVWLDDLFDEKTEPNDVDIVEQVATALSAGPFDIPPKLADLTPEDPAEEWSRRIRERLDKIEIDEFLAQIKPKEDNGERTADYSPGELEEVVASLGSKVQRIGLAAWSREKDRLIAAGDDGMFLVDREGSVGGARTTVGDEIVKELIEKCPKEVLVIVLTHSVGAEGAEDLRRLLATELNVPIARLGVVSKRSADASLPSSLRTGVRAAVRTTLTQLTCSVITKRISDAMGQSLSQTVSALAELPIAALDRAIFENSLSEGASEIDVLCRILLSTQRTAIDSHIAGALEEVHSPLARIRKLRNLEPLPKLPSGDPDLLRKWRRDELFDVADRLNSLRAPLACGDVFQKLDTQKYFMLLGQPCDLMVRPNGHRNAEEAMFVKVDATLKEASNSGPHFFEIPALDGEGSWALDFRKWVAVNLSCLEWATFNGDGRVAFIHSAVAPTGLLPGWEKRFERAKNQFRVGRVYCLSIGEIPNKMVSASVTGVEFPYHRVGRLRGPRAVAAYAAFASFHARAAFDHDFAKGIGENKPEEVAVAKPATEKPKE